MNIGHNRFLDLGIAASCVLALAPAAVSQDGTLVIHAKPSQAYVFVDGVALGDAGLSGFHRLILRGISAGQHKLGIYNYGYKSETRIIEIEPKKTTRLDVQLQPLSGTVSGPWGRIQIEGAPRAAVLLNGKTPDYLVGHGDEFDHDIIWKQELLVPPGTHQITLVHGDAEIWSGKVTVGRNERVIVNARKGGTARTTKWPRGEKLASVPRFRAGIASATVAVGPTTADFSASPAKINCGESSRLVWKTGGMVGAEISGMGAVSTEGEQAVQPKETTTYKFTASGPGGVFDQSAAVTVDKAVTASLDVSPQEVRYHRVDDKEVESGTTTVSWSASNAASVSIEGLGTVGPNGSRTLRVTPKKTDLGPVDESVPYTLTATNACGGTETRTASLHIVGSIEKTLAKSVVVETLETKLSLNSVYFPTAMPSRQDPKGGLVPSQQHTLTDLADNFKKYLEFRPEAHLILEAHADKRGTPASNQALTERRVNRVKDLLMQEGVPPADIDTRAFGQVKNLDEKEVRQLTEQNPNLSPDERKKILSNLRAIVWANNRRVDVVLSTTGQQSARVYPFNAPDSRELLAETRKAKPPAKKTTPRKKR